MVEAGVRFILYSRGGKRKSWLLGVGYSELRILVRVIWLVLLG